MLDIPPLLIPRQSGNQESIHNMIALKMMEYEKLLLKREKASATAIFITKRSIKIEKYI
ncbi:MAG: hypothetical protein ABI472_09225 [Ginsengibacter sp.]